ncbi:MAG: hypothetical protein Q9191_000688 [Dirinaria sp. TL-2023a]
MALGANSDVIDTSNTHGTGAKDNQFSQYGADGTFAADPEKADTKMRKMSRVGGPIPGIAGDSDVDSTLSVGKQLELEQTNSIKYRTCSWQKREASRSAALN